MNFFKKISYIFIFLSISLVPYFQNNLEANELRLNIGFWPGELDPELEPRFFNDDLIEGGTLGRIDLEWSNKNTYTIYPLGFQYFIPAGNGKIMIGANYILYNPEYRFNGIYPFGAVSLVELKDFFINDIEGELGYQINAGKNLYITPKLGSRLHKQTFTYNEITIGNVFGITIGNNDFEATALGTYAGVDLQLYLEKNISFVFEYLNTAFFPGFGGDMKFKTTTFYTGDILAITNQSSSYDVKIERYKLGLQYDIDSTKHIQFGFRQETQTHSYPGYFNLSLIITPGGADVGLDSFREIVTDIFFWQQEEKQKKGLIYFQFSYDIPM